MKKRGRGRDGKAGGRVNAATQVIRADTMAGFGEFGLSPGVSPEGGGGAGSGRGKRGDCGVEG